MQLWNVLQTYGFKNKKTGEIEVYTYVDYVDYNGPAGIAGMRRGNDFYPYTL